MTDSGAATTPGSSRIVAEPPLRLLVVRRDHGTLFEYLRDRLADIADVRILLDRRVAQRRTALMTVPEDRRADRRDRRHQLGGPERDRWESLGYCLAPPVSGRRPVRPL
jgi:hypothetical protein